VEISGIEIHADPRALYGFDDLQHARRFRDNAAMVFDPQKDALPPRVIRALLKSANAVRDCLCTRLIFRGAACKDADVRGAQNGCAIDPSLD
jgi:hypothetical protein